MHSTFLNYLQSGVMDRISQWTLNASRYGYCMLFYFSRYAYLPSESKVILEVFPEVFRNSCLCKGSSHAWDKEAATLALGNCSLLEEILVHVKSVEA